MVVLFLCPLVEWGSPHGHHARRWPVHGHWHDSSELHHMPQTCHAQLPSLDPGLLTLNSYVISNSTSVYHNIYSLLDPLPFWPLVLLYRAISNHIHSAPPPSPTIHRLLRGQKNYAVRDNTQLLDSCAHRHDVEGLSLPTPTL